MNRPAPAPGGLARPLGLLLLAALVVTGLPADAQTITVTSAVPAETEQGTLGLVVAIGGAGFDRGSKVAFYVTGTTNPGGIVVKNVKYRSAKSLEATIDVAPDAQVQLKFDVQVMSGTRTGKGTELFKVLVKVTGGDLTPPGAVTDLHVVETGFNTTAFGWKASANDGYDATSGPADRYALRVRLASCGPYTDEIWGDPASIAITSDPCHVASTGATAGAPGSDETKLVLFLSPDTGYIAAVRTVDASTQGPNWSPLPDPSLQLLFTTGPPPAVPWSATIVDFTPATSTDRTSQPRLAFDDAGRPGMLYTKHNDARLAIWTEQAGWQADTVAAEIDIGNYGFDLAFDPDPVANQPAIANVVRVIGPVNGMKNQLRLYRRLGATSEPWQADLVATGDITLGALHFAPDSLPTIVFHQNVKTNLSVVRFAQRHGASWTVEDVASRSTGPSRLAFDTPGNPAASFVKPADSAPGIAFARRIGGSWLVEQPENPPGSPWNAVSDTAVAFDPLRGDFAIAGIYRDTVDTSSYFNRLRIRVCDRNSGAWSCDTPVEGHFWCHRIGLAFGADGTAYLAYYETGTIFVLVRRPGQTSWTREFVRADAAIGTPVNLRIKPDGQMFLATSSPHDPTGAGAGSKAVVFAQSPVPWP